MPGRAAFQDPVNEQSRPDPVGLPGTGQVAPGQYPQAPGHPSGAVAGAGDGEGGDHPGDRVLEAAQGPGGGARRKQHCPGGSVLNADATEPGQIVLSTSPAGTATDVPGGGRFPQTQRPWGGWCSVLFGVGPAKRRRPLLKLDLPALLATPPWPGPRGLAGSPPSFCVLPRTTAVGVVLAR